VNLRDIEQAIADEKARIDAAHAAVAEAREALERAERAQIEATLKAEARIVALEAAAQLFVEVHEGEALHNPRKDGNVNLRMHTEKHARPRGQRLKTKSSAAKRIREVDGSIGAFAAKHKVPASTVYGWYAAEFGRKIPRDWADKLARKPYLIPLEDWPNGVASDGE
jgi:hypothetical protein